MTTVQQGTLTYAALVGAQACAEGLTFFRKQWGKDGAPSWAEVAGALAEEPEGVAWWGWLGEQHGLVPSGIWTEYERVTAPARAEYQRVTAPAEAEYQRVTATARAEYQRVTAPAEAKYQRVTAPARAKYQRVTAPAWAEYERVTAPAWAEYERVTATAWAEHQRVLREWLRSVPRTRRGEWE